MRYSLTSGIILAAMTIGDAMAGPTHAHHHRHAHDKAKRVDWNDPSNYKGVDFAKAYAEGQASTAVAASPAATPAPSVEKVNAAVVAPKSSAAATASHSSAAPSSGTNSGAAGGKTVNGFFGMNNGATSFGSPIPFVDTKQATTMSNYGNPQCSNMFLASGPSASPLSNTVVNDTPGSITVACWNNGGYPFGGSAADAQPNYGMSSAPKQSCLTFELAPGAAQTVAMQENTIGGCAQATTTPPVSAGFGTSWAEFKFITSGTGGGYDVTSIQNPGGNNYNMTIVSIGDNGKPDQCVSAFNANHWVSDAQDESTQSLSCWVPPGRSTMQLVTHLAGPLA